MAVTSSKTLVTSVTVTVPVTSPSVQLAASDTYWSAIMDTTAHAGSSLDFVIQSSPDNASWSDVSNNHLDGADGTGKFGNDLSHQHQTFTLFGAGPWWRMKVTSVTGSILINSLSVNNGT